VAPQGSISWPPLVARFRRLRTEIAIPERRLLMGFGFFRENALSKWTLGAIEARHDPAIGS
jgi:hypothetical protein